MNGARELAAVSMSHVFVTMDASRRLSLGILRKHLVDYLGMAIEAGVLRHASISRLDMNWLVKVLERECQ